MRMRVRESETIKFVCKSASVGRFGAVCTDFDHRGAPLPCCPVDVSLLIRLRDKKTEVILNAASVWESGGPTRSEGSRGMAWGRPETGTARTGCFDSVPSAACARDGTPLSMTRDIVTQPEKHRCFNGREFDDLYRHDNCYNNH